MTAAHEKCSKVLRSLRFDWAQDPEVVLNERLKTIGLESEYLKTELELFKVFHQKLYQYLERKYRPLLDFVVPIHFRWQTTVMWFLIKCIPTNAFTYDYKFKLCQSFEIIRFFFFVFVDMYMTPGVRN